MLRRDLYNFARIFNLIIHYELGNNDLLEYVIKSTARQLNKGDSDYVPETIVIKHLRKLIKFNNEKARLDAYNDMKNELEKIKEQLANIV